MKNKPVEAAGPRREAEDKEVQNTGRDKPAEEGAFSPGQDSAEESGLYEELSELLHTYYSLDPDALYPDSVREALSSLRKKASPRE